MPATLLITALPASLAKSALEATTAIVAVGPEAPKVIASYGEMLGLKAPETPPPGDDEVLLWDRTRSEPPMVVGVEGPSSEHRRHVRKYAKGTLGEDKSFYFRGPKGALNLRAHNVSLFLQMADGVDDDTWEFHRRRRDYSQWFREAIKDSALADEVEHAERADLGVAASREAIQEAVGRRYAPPAEA
jgi:hypothetical protein